MVNPTQKLPRTFEDTLVRHCAPTLAGMKLGSIFCFKHPEPEAIRKKTRQWDRQLTPLGLSVQILLERPGSGSMIVYVYRKDMLEQTLSDKECQRFLARAGYEISNPDGLLAQLSHRLRTQAGFPHEIGVFLGYPLQDVAGFIENQGRNFTCCGFWKSYSDPVKTQACFERYHKCIRAYTTLFEQGVSIENLVAPA